MVHSSGEPTIRKRDADLAAIASPCRRLRVKLAVAAEAGLDLGMQRAHLRQFAGLEILAKKNERREIERGDVAAAWRFPRDAA